MKRASLNHVYRLVWNERLNAWVAVAENVKSRGKRASRALSLSVLMALGLAPAAHALDGAALPTNGQIIAGQGSVSSQGNTLTLNQTSNRLIAQWDTFNIGKDSSVVFNQAGASSVALNRILDSNPSEIFGSLSANGQVFLVNPSGIVFGRGAQVNVGGLVASSLNISNEDFLAGNLTFTGSNASGAIANQGSITAANGGVVALLAPQVTNEGTITANGGSALLAAGSGVSLDFVGDGLISYNIDAGTTNALVENGGLIQADGGLAVLTTKAADAVSQAVVNNTGTVRAQTLAQREGRILLISDMQYGTTFHDGTLDASAPNGGQGGFIETSAANVKLGENALIDTRAANGDTGEWLLDPSDIVIAASGGTMTGATLATQLNANNVILDTSAGSGGNGDITVNDAITSTGSYLTGGVGSGHTLTLIATRDITINNAITGSMYPLSVELRASRDTTIGSTGSINTNGGNFVVGSAPTVIGSMATASGTGFSVANGGYVSVGTGSLDINVSGTIQLAANSLRATGSTYRFLNSGYTDYNQISYMRLKAGTGITTINADAAIADITGMTYVTLDSAEIGTSLNPIKISRTSLGHALTVNNTAGNSYVNVLNANATHGFSTVAVNINQQASKTQRLLLGGDIDGHGHITMNTDASGVLTFAGDDIDTSGTRSNIAINARDIQFADNSVNVGKQYFTATASTMLGSGNNNVADVLGGTLTLSGTQLGSNARRLEVGGGNVDGGADTIYLNNGGGSTYAASVDDSFRNVYLSNVKTAGAHSVRFAADHIDYTTDGTGILLPTLSSSTGTDVSAGNRFVSFTANSGDIRFDTDSVNTGSGTLQAVISSGNSDGGSGDVIHAVNAKDAQAEITTGNAEFIVYRSGTGAIADIELAQGVGAADNTLTVSTYAGAVDLTELTLNHFKSLNLTLSGWQSNGQSVNIDLNGNDDISFSDAASLLILDGTRVNLSDFDRSWQLSAGNRNVQIDSTALGSGNYNVHANNLYLNGDVLTDGGNITLNAASNNIYLMNSVRIDSNADDAANSTSTGAAGSISLTGSVSSSNGAGRILTADAGSTTTNGGTIYFNGHLTNSGGYYLGGAYFTTKGNTDTGDGSLTFAGSFYQLDGTFSAIGNTNFNSTFLDVLIDTEQGNDGDAGNIIFGGMGLTGSQYSGYRFNAVTTALYRNGGNVDLDTANHSTFNAKSVVVDTSGGGLGTSGNIDLPAISTAGTYYNGTTTDQSYTGNVITLHGNLSTNGGNVTLMGDTRLAESVTIKTSITNPATAAGSVTFGYAGVSATASGKDLTINTTTTTSSAYNAGAVTLRSGNASGSTINNLSIDTRALGTGGSSADITLATVMATGVVTAGNQSYSARNVTASVSLDAGGSISITNASNQTFTQSAAITADSLLLRGGTFTLSNAGNQVDTLAAQSGALTYTNSGALTIGSVGGVNGVTSSGTVGVSTVSGDLTLARSVSSTNTGASAIVLNAGSSAAAGAATGGNILVSDEVTVTTGTGGRATLYSGSVDDSTGLTQLVGSGSSRFRYNSDESSSGFTKALGAGLHAIYREQPTISVAVNDATAVYGSIATPGSTLVDGKNGDTSTNFTYSVGDGDGATADGAVSTSGHYIVGTHSISATSSSGAEELGYDVSGTTGAVLTITPKQLTLAGLTSNRTYNGTTHAAVIDGSDAIVSGLAVGDLVTQNYAGATGTFGDKNVGTGKALTIVGLALGGADAANYTVTGSGTGNITARVLNVGFDGVSRTYDGTTAANVVASDDRIANDALTIGQTASFGDKNVGTGKHIDVSSITLSGADSGNYVLASTTGSATGDITARTLNVGFTGASRVYDGTTAATVSSSDDRIAGDDLTIEQTAAFGDKNAGTGKTVNVSNAALSGADAGNYVLASTTGSTTGDIAARTLNVGFTGVNRVYDGTTVATVTSSDDRIAGDELSIERTAAFGDKNAETGKTVNISNVAISGADAGNYVLAPTASSTTGDIAARTLNVSFTGDNRVYDGTTEATVSSSDDRIDGDDLTISQTAAFGDQNAGTGKIVNVSDVAISGADAGNYVLASTTGSTTANIQPNGVSGNILASVTSPQSGLNGTSSNLVNGAENGASVGAHTIGGAGGSGTLIQSSAPVIGDHRVAFFTEVFSMSSGSGASSLRLSQSAASTTLTIADASAKPAEQSALPLYHALGSVARFSSGLAVVDSGNSLSVASAAGATSMTINIVEPRGPVAAGSITRANAAAIELQVTVVPDSILLVTLPADAPAIDDNEAALIALALASGELDVTAQQLKGMVIRRR